MPFVSRDNALDSKGKVKKGITVSTDKNGRVRYIGPKMSKPPMEPEKKKKEPVKKGPVKKGPVKKEKVIDDIHSNDNDKLTLEFEI